MKKKYFFLYVLMLFSGSVFAQDTVAKPPRNPNRFRMCVLSKIYYIQPGSTGDNFLSKAHKGSYGAGTEINFITVYNFYFGLGYNFARYDVTDVSLASNADHTNVSTFFAKVYYKVPVTEKFSVNHALMVGGTWMKQHKVNSEYSSQDDSFIGLGVDAEYECAHWFAVFAGARYNFITTGIESSPQYSNFFRKLNQFNVCVGVRFGTNK